MRKGKKTKEHEEMKEVTYIYIVHPIGESITREFYTEQDCKEHIKELKDKEINYVYRKVIVVEKIYSWDNKEE